MSGYLTRLSGDVRRDAPEPARGFGDALRGRAGVAVVAEIKRASPSEGGIAPAADVAGTAQSYADGGAAAMSVLVAERDFGGSLADLREARAAVGLRRSPRSSRCFPEQVAAQRMAGADAVLVLLALLSDGEAGRLMQTAELLGMDALVEAHTAEEVERALGLDAVIVGVNARDLESLRGRSRPPARAARDAAAVHRAGRPVGDGVAGRRRGRPRRGGRRRPRRDVAHAPSGAPGRAGGGGAMTQVKICGLMRPEDVDAAVAAGADLVGFILVEGTPRYLEPDRARALAARVPDRVRTVAVVGVPGMAPVEGFALTQTYDSAGGVP